MMRRGPLNGCESRLTRVARRPFFGRESRAVSSRRAGHRPTSHQVRAAQAQLKEQRGRPNPNDLRVGRSHGRARRVQRCPLQSVSRSPQAAAIRGPRDPRKRGMPQRATRCVVPSQQRHLQQDRRPDAGAKARCQARHAETWKTIEAQPADIMNPPAGSEAPYGCGARLFWGQLKLDDAALQPNHRGVGAVFGAEL